MLVLVSGSSGLVGRPLVERLRARGAQVRRLVREQSAPAPDTFLWDPAAARIDPKALEGVDAVVHLAGENLAARRWTAAQKARIRDSRMQGTTLLAGAAAAAKTRPAVFVSASAVGFYGERGEEVLTEASPPGSGFLPEICVAWERCCDPAREAGIRVCHPRFGVILSAAGGALKKMLPPFRMGLGGRLGSGRQWMSLVHLDDVLAAILTLLDRSELSGPVDVVCPEPVRNADFTRTLGSVLRRPAFMTVPAFAARLAFGQMADDALLASTRVLPARLQQSGFSWRHPTVESALRAELAKDS